jgi:hypothetical protein
MTAPARGFVGTISNTPLIELQQAPGSHRLHDPAQRRIANAPIKWTPRRSAVNGGRDQLFLEGREIAPRGHETRQRSRRPLGVAPSSQMQHAILLKRNR